MRGPFKTQLHPIDKFVDMHNDVGIAHNGCFLYLSHDWIRSSEKKHKGQAISISHSTINLILDLLPIENHTCIMPLILYQSVAQLIENRAGELLKQD